MKKKFFNAKIYRNDEATEMIVENGKITHIGTNLPKCEDEIDLGGKLVLPPYVDPHLHLDYVYTLSELGESGAGSGTLFEAIELWPRFKETLTVESVKRLAMKAIKDEVSQGVQHIRTHIDVTDPKFTALQAMLEMKQELKDTVDIQIVAFPQEGMYMYKGGVELVEEGLKMGADVVGGIPHYEPAREFGEKSVHDIVKLGLKYDKMIDVHCDETDDPHSRFLEVLAEEARSRDMGSRVTASHTTAMGSYDNAYCAKLFRLLGHSGISFVSCPTESIHLQGRFDNFPKRRGVTRVNELLEAGMNVCFGQDSIVDPWYPLGNGNILRVLEAGLHICHMLGYSNLQRALDLVTDNSAKAMALGDRYGLEPGRPANLLILSANSDYEVIRSQGLALYSIRNGKVLMKRQPAQVTFL